MTKGSVNINPANSTDLPHYICELRTVTHCRVLITLNVFNRVDLIMFFVGGANQTLTVRMHHCR